MEDIFMYLDDGAVAPSNSLMWSLMADVCRAMGVRTDVPFNQLTDAERDIVFNGPAVKKTILYKAKKSETAGELDFTYYNAVYTVENALSKVTDEKEMRQMSVNVGESFLLTARRLVDLDLGYLSLDRASSTLSTGERQRMQLVRVVRNRTTGILYVLDEPSIGLHPANINGLKAVMHDLIADGNSIVLVDHDTQILRDADYIIDMGSGGGQDGGRIVAAGTPGEVRDNPDSVTTRFIK